MSLPQPSAGGAPCLRRGGLAAAAIAFSLASLSACAAGSSASTLQVRPDNPEAKVGVIRIQNANVITEPHGAKGPAVVTGKIFNNGHKDQTLDSITLQGTASKVRLHPAKGSGPLTVPAGGALILGGKGNASAVIPNGSRSVTDGDVQQVVFQLSDTGAVKLGAFVVPATSYFTKFGPSTVPTPSASASPSGSPSGSPTGSPTGAAGAQGTAKAGATNGTGKGGASGAGARQSPKASESAATH